MSPALGPVSRQDQPPASSLQFVPDTAPGLASTVMRPVVAACLVYSNVAAAGVETGVATPGLHAASLR